MTFWGFLGLTATTGCVWIMTWFLGFETPLELTNPVKILGNVSTVVVLIGLSILWAMRASGDQKVGRSTYSDWLFISVLLTTIVTGFLSQVTRLADIAARMAHPHGREAAVQRCIGSLAPSNAPECLGWQ